MTKRRGQLWPGPKVLVDTGFLIAADKNPSAAMAHLKAATSIGQVHFVIAPVVVEALAVSRKSEPLSLVMKGMQAAEVLVSDGFRASELVREVKREAHTNVGVTDSLVAAVAERLHAVVYTSDPRDLRLLQDAGAQITVGRVPF